MKSETSPLVPGLDRTSGQFRAAYQVLDQAIATRAFPGCAFGVLAGDSVVLQDARGRFTYEDNAAAVAAETVFDVASLTKVAATTVESSERDRPALAEVCAQGDVSACPETGGYGVFMCPRGGLEPPCRWYIPESGIHH